MEGEGEDETEINSEYIAWKQAQTNTENMQIDKYKSMSSNDNVTKYVYQS